MPKIPKIKYTKRERGGYYATTDDRRTWIVQRADRHRTTSSYFRWTARGFGHTGNGATRGEAVRDAQAKTLVEARAIVQKAVSIYRGGKVHVRAVKCANCLLSADRLVSAEGARELIAVTRDGDAGSFVCHRNQVSDEPEAICRSWWDAFAEENWRLRLAKGLGIVQFVGPGGEGS